MKLIPLTQDKFAKVDDADFDWLSQFKWYPHKWKRSRAIYAVRNVSAKEFPLVGKKQLTMHEMLLPGVPKVDHKDNDGLNNQRHNLRAATHQQNIANARGRIGHSSPFKGVRFRADRSCYQARLGKTYLGSFDTAEDAARTYNAAAKKQYGDFAYLNPV